MDTAQRELGDDGEPGPRACVTCGRLAGGDDAGAAALLTWSRGVENGRVVWTCDVCTRRHARSIEGKLDSAWW
ncbi:MAG TPA: hypothetical protein PLA46_12195 [Phycicoccus sp.]|nr:hypothetical protein [Phycicoccus sp.]